MLNKGQFKLFNRNPTKMLEFKPLLCLLIMVYKNIYIYYNIPLSVIYNNGLLSTIKMPKIAKKNRNPGMRSRWLSLMQNKTCR